jgi:hypothetical protein
VRINYCNQCGDYDIIEDIPDTGLSNNLSDQLSKDNAELRRAGCELAEAALHVAREYDGIHRLMLAVSEWTKVVANEGGRNKKDE